MGPWLPGVAIRANNLTMPSSGLKVCGQGEWHSQKHGEKKAKRWKKLHIGVDDQGQIFASTVSESHEQDPSQVPDLLNQIDQEIERFIGDGIYDQEPVYTAVENHSPGVRVIIPTRKDAVLSLTAATSLTQRDQHLLEIERVGRFAWKRTSGYYDQTHAENAFSRFKPDVRRPPAGEAGGIPGAGSLSGLRVAQSDVGTGSASVLSRQLKRREWGECGPCLIHATNPRVPRGTPVNTG